MCLVPVVEIVEADPVRERGVGDAEALAPLAGLLGVHVTREDRVVERRDRLRREVARVLLHPRFEL